MQDFLVKLSSIEEIKRFVSIATVQDCDIEVSSGSRTTSAKSLMGMFNFDVEEPIRVLVRGAQEDMELFCCAVAEFVVSKN